MPASIYFDKVFYGGNGDGILQRHHDGNLYDTEPVVSQMDFAMMVPDDPETECSLEKFTVVTYGGGQKFLINTNYLARVADGDTIGTERFDAGFNRPHSLEHGYQWYGAGYTGVWETAQSPLSTCVITTSTRLPQVRSVLRHP